MTKTSTNKIILVPRLSNQGGIANYYRVLKPYLQNSFTYVYRGKSSRSNKFWRFITDYFNFYQLTFNSRNDGVVLINSSLGFGGFFRDGLYSLITPRKKKRIIFFRGWNPSFENKIQSNWFLKYWLRLTFLKADHLIVLSSKFKKKLFEFGYTGSITVETTVVDETLMQNFSIEELNKKNEKFGGSVLLYVGNIHKEKGVREITDSLALLKRNKKIHDFNLNMAGTGPDVDLLKDKAQEENIPLHFLGYIQGKEKSNAFKKANIFLFASYHEGMPNAVLEAMAFGLPIMTTPVGGIPDFFVEGKMGFFLESREPEYIAERIEYLMERPKLMEEISLFNYYYAKEHFYACKVAKRLEAIINDVIEI